MAKLRFVTGKVTGRMGEFVGSMWKGINYIRTYTKPSNPKTPSQNSIRLVFKKLSDFASGLYAHDLLVAIPQARHMTERNSVFRANKQMLSDKIFVPEALQVAKPNISLDFAEITATHDTATNYVAFTSRVIKNADQELPTLTAHFFVYNSVTGFFSAVFPQVVSFGSQNTVSLSGDIKVPEDIGKPNGTLKSDYRLLALVSGEDADGKRIISQTANVALA